jgi:integrase
MTVYRPGKSPYYHYDFVFKKTRYHGSTGLTTKAEAKTYEADRRREIASGKKDKPGITLDDGVGVWWEQKGRHERNAKTVEGHGATLIRILGGNKLMGDIEIGDFRHFIARRRAHITNRKKPLSPASINRELEIARIVWRLCAESYAVSTIDWGKLMLKEAQERVRELSADEERRLFAHLPDDLAAVAEFAILSGQRRTAIITLLWSRVDLGGGRATVRTKGDVDHTFPLTPRMVALIANRPKAGPYVFTYECERNSPARPGRPQRIKGVRYPFSQQGWVRKWKKALKDARIDDFRFHDLRHTTGTRVLRASGNLKVVQKLLNHTNITTTARYAHALEDDVRTAMNATESRTIPEANSVTALKPRRKA